MGHPADTEGLAQRPAAGTSLPDVSITKLTPQQRRQAARTTSGQRARQRRLLAAPLASSLELQASTAAATAGKVVAEGPTDGPLGLIIPFSTPICKTSDGNKAILVLFVDHEEIEFIHGTGLSIQQQWTFWTLQTPNEALGAHRMSVGCYDSGIPETSSEEPLHFTISWESEGIWKDEGFQFENTAAQLPDELSAHAAGPGYILGTTAGAPAGTDACPTVDATPWTRVRIYFYSAANNDFPGGEETYSLSDPAVTQLGELPFEIPLSFKDGEDVQVVVACDRRSSDAGAFDPEYVYQEPFVFLNEPAGGPLSHGELLGGARNPSEYCLMCFMAKHMSFGQPVDAPTGNFWHSFTDVSVPGRGFNLDLTRTYNSDNAGVNGPFGYGWSWTYGMALGFPDATHVVVNQENGAQVTFEEQAGGAYAAPTRVMATLEHLSDGTWRFVRRATQIFTFNASGQLTTESDRDGNVTTLAYDSEGQLETVTDSSGRKLSLSYSGNRIVGVTDPIGRTVSYGYDSAGNLVDVTDVAGGDTHFGYDAAHRMVNMRLPDQAPGVPGATGAALTNVYDSSGRVVEQVDQLGRRTAFAYNGEPLGPNGGWVTVTDPVGDEVEQYYQWGKLLSETRGANTLEAATWSFEYDPATLGVTRITDPNGDTTHFTYDAAGNVLTTEDTLGRVTTNTYDGLNDLLTTTDPTGVTTTMTYDARGNLLTRSRPLVGTAEVQTTSYVYGDAAHPGDVTEEVNPVGAAWKYSYDAYGDRLTSTDPLGRQSRATYNAIGWCLSTTTPRGLTTTYAHNAFGQVTQTTDPLGHASLNAFDPDQNLVESTDPNGHTTRYSYDADDERIAVHRADGSTLMTTYWADGSVDEQIDGAGHATRYDYNALHDLRSVTDPLGRTTYHYYDRAGNEIQERHADESFVSKTYDAANELTSVTYSDGTPAVTGITYDGDGRRTAEHDGSGERRFSYDSLGRMTAVTDGSGAQVGYEYDLAGHLTRLTYPNGKPVMREYDLAGQLIAIKDWLGHTTTVAYDKDLNIRSVGSAGGAEEIRSYDNADQLTGIEDTKATATLARFEYTRNANGQVVASEDENGEANKSAYSYDELGRLTSLSGSAYSYDAADNPVGFGTGVTQVFDASNQLMTRSEPGEPPPEEEPKGGKESPHEEPTGGKEPLAEESQTTRPPTHSGGGSVLLPLGSGGVEDSHAAHAVQPLAVVEATRRRGGRTLTSASLHTSGSNDLVLALISASGSARQRVNRVSAPGLHWSRVARQNGAGGDVEMWQARATKQLLNTAVTAQLHTGGQHVVMTVLVFGAAAYLSQDARRSGQRSSPSVSLTPNASGALIVAAGHSNGQKTPSVPSGGQRLLAHFYDRAKQSAGWIQMASGTAGPASVSDATTAAHWSVLGATIRSTTGLNARAARALGTSLAKAAAVASATATEEHAGLARPVTARAALGTVIRKFVYDARGNRITSVVGGVTRTLSYNGANELTGISSGTSYAYNGDGLRVSKTVGGTTTHFVWNESEPVPGLLAAGETYYVYGPNEEPIEQISGSTASFLHQDQQGSTRLLTDPSGAVIGRYNYDAWGNVISHTGEATTSLRYDGQYTDPESGYQYLRARYYDPTTGQFLTRDPVFALTLSEYGYASDQPTDLADPLGLVNWWHVAKAVGLGVSVAGAVVCFVASDGLASPACVALTRIGTAVDIVNGAHDCATGDKSCSGSAVCVGSDFAPSTLEGISTLCSIGQNAPSGQSGDQSGTLQCRANDNVPAQIDPNTGTYRKDSNPNGYINPTTGTYDQGLFTQGPLPGSP